VTTSTICVRSKTKYRHYLFDVSYLEVFGVLTGVGVDVSKFFEVGAAVLKPEAGAESESEKWDSAHRCTQPTRSFRQITICISKITQDLPCTVDCVATNNVTHRLEPLNQWFSKFFSYSPLTNPNAVSSSPTKYIIAKISHYLLCRNNGRL